MRSILLSVFLFPAFFLPAQDLPFIFGQMDPLDWEQSQCEAYAGSPAVVLGSSGKLEFDYFQGEGWKFLLEVTERIKVLSPAGKEYGDVVIRLYNPASQPASEELRYLTGHVYNLVDGQIEKTVLRPSDQYIKRIDDYWVEVTLAFPQVQEGTVLEYQYKLVSNYLFNLRTWFFQREIPVRYSRFQYAIPQYFHYQVLKTGMPLDMEQVREDFLAKMVIGSRGEILVKCLRMNLTAREVAALHPEPFQVNAPDLPAQVEFQLVTYYSPWEEIADFASSYESFSDWILHDGDFGKRLSSGKFAEELLPSAAELSEKNRASEFLEKAQNHFSWDGDYGFFSQKAGNRAFKNITGSAPDINLSLVAGFRHLGLEAYPVLLSTRGHGTVMTEFPNFNRFNYVAALVVVDGQDYLADATASLPLGSLPLRCLNGKGWVVDIKKGRWIDLKADARSSQVTFCQMKREGTTWKAELKVLEKGYAAYDSHWKRENRSSEVWERELVASFEGWQLTSLEPGKWEEGSIQYSFGLEKEADEGEEPVYLAPLAFGYFEDNPFLQPDRISAIDFPYAQSRKLVFNLEIPEGWEVEYPVPERIGLLGEAALFSYQVSFNSDSHILRVIAETDLRQTEYSPSDYAYLREFFQRIEDKRTEFVVLTPPQ